MDAYKFKADPNFNYYILFVLYMCVEICFHCLSLMRPEIHVIMYKLQSSFIINTRHVHKNISLLVTASSDIQHPKNLCGKKAELFSIKASSA
jgi:hypothetical protein